MEIFRGIDRVMQSLGLNASTVIFPTRFSPVIREDLLETLLRFRMVNAVLTVNLTPSVEAVEKYNKVGKPLILLQTSVPGAQSVLLENQKGMSIAINYLFLCRTPADGTHQWSHVRTGTGAVPSERSWDM